MPLFAQRLKFKHRWRDYQEKILDSLDTHLSDKKINVVAAPGAGKTTLGIEILRRIGHPVLILAPTITIRNQWSQRIVADFSDGDIGDFVSLNPKEPKPLTIATYQGLLAAFCDSEAAQKETDETSEEEDEKNGKPPENRLARFDTQKAKAAVARFKTAGIDTLCLDEAHHLRREWWKALTFLNDTLKPARIISLTATPPYDVEIDEWQRYEALCGEIDAFISIPELVKNKDLCPHQDFVYFSQLRAFEQRQADEFGRNADRLLKGIFTDNALVQALTQLPEFQSPDRHIETILEDPVFFMGASALLKMNHIDISRSFTELYGISPRRIPEMDRPLAEHFLQGLLFTHRNRFPALADTLKTLEKTARDNGFVVSGKISISDNARQKRLLGLSLGKIDAVLDIVASEQSAMGDALRMVVLADYIRTDELNAQIKSLGVAPIFESLRRAFKDAAPFGVLTGSLVVIPAFAREAFERSARAHGLASNEYLISPLPFDGRFVRISPSLKARGRMVGIITDIFREGHVRVLVGTQALLGEGWDAPCINSLVLSSTVSAYMLSNQMRGRAIRTDKENPDKVANIWHVCSIKFPTTSDVFMSLKPRAITDQQELADAFAYEHDLHVLDRRFLCFEGPDIKPPHDIESGWNRLRLKMFGLNQEHALLKNNPRTCERARDRDFTRRIWAEGLKDPYNAPPKRLQNALTCQPKTKWLLYSANLLVLFFGACALAGYVSRIALPRGFAAAATVFCFVVAVVMFKPVVFTLKCASPQKLLKHIARTTLETLAAMDLIKTNPSTIHLSVKKILGESFISAENMTPSESNLFMDALREILEVPQNPRYLLVRKHTWYNLTQKDYHGVPTVVSRHKKYVEIFEHLWNRYVGPCELVYTRNHAGRLRLLRARNNCYAAAWKKQAGRINRWG